MGSRRSRKSKARENFISEMENVLNPIEAKDEQEQGSKRYRHYCTFCPNWTRCVGYEQNKICSRKSKGNDENKKYKYPDY